ncbi:MAG: phosphoesterase [Planctomycetota bacterium]
MPDVEHILVIPAAVVDSVGPFEGFQCDVDKYLTVILNSPELSFRPRDQMEQDPSFKQLIPYILLRHRDEDGNVRLFTYTRGGGGGESRLHAKRSVGIGGHISREDAAGQGHPYDVGMQRELDEEVQLPSAYRSGRVGLIYDPSTAVGTVHLGVVHVFDLEQALANSNEADLAEAEFQTLEQLRQQWDRLETWSQLAIDALHPAGREVAG